MAKQIERVKRKRKKRSPLYVRDKVYVPVERADLQVIRDKLHINHFREQGCAPCEYKDERPCDVCQTCPNYYGLFKFYETKEINGRDFVGVALGRRDIVRQVIGNPDQYDVHDERVTDKMPYQLKFVGQPYEYQQKAVEEMLKHQTGILVSDPRTGKTIMCTMWTCVLGLRTLIMVHQDDLADQFYKTFMGDPTAKPEPKPAFTNAPELEEKLGKKLVILAKTAEDYLNPDACVIIGTYQKFLHIQNKQLLKQLVKRIGHLSVDEGHRANADEYSRILSKFWAKHRYTFTATPDRKDCLVANSKVYTSEGLKNIEQIKIGDLVVSKSPSMNILELKPVIETHTRSVSNIIEVQYEEGTLRLTLDHKIWSYTRQSWIKAKDLSINEEIMILDHI